jgi:EAL domain-containing protein (putative c-di-GMP-specific phosphodiesterase class I)
VTFELLPGFSREEFAAGATVFNAGDVGDAAYLVESGSVEVLLEAEGVLLRGDLLAEGALFGEIALLDRLPRSGTVRTLTPTVLVRIDRSFVDELLRGTDPVIQYLMRLLLERLRRERAARGQAADAAQAPQVPPASQTSLQAASSPAQGRAAGDVGDDRADPLQSSAMRTLWLSRDLSDAIDANQLELHYQPILRLDDLRLAGYEALVRWRHPQQGLVRPDEFIPLAERTGMIHRIGRWVLERAVADWPALRALCDPREASPFMSVNLSAPELSVSGVAASVARCLAHHGMAASELRIELTETTAIGNITAVSQATRALRETGVGITLDDFGTGYAGLSCLQELPFSCLKIDRAFVSQMLGAERSMHIVKLALEMSRLMGLSTVAEGIEDGPTAQALRDLGCTYAQGYFFARPMPVAGVQAWHQARS